MEPDADDDALPPEPRWPSAAASVFAWAQQQPLPWENPNPRSAALMAERERLEEELARTRAELAAMEDLLEDLPQIFERKFQQRLQPLLEENAELRRQLQQLQATWMASQAALLPPARPPRRRLQLGKALRHAFGLPPASGDGAGHAATDDDDEQGSEDSGESRRARRVGAPPTDPEFTDPV